MPSTCSTSLVSPSKYALGEVLGTGGMGIVYRARTSAGLPVVVKVLRPEVASNPNVVSRFAAEIRATRRLDHPNIAHYVDSGDNFLVLEYVEGILLGEAIDALDLFSLGRVTSIGEQLLCALAHAHARGVIHADVKSDNLLLDTERGGDHVTLIDFGVARLDDDPPPVGEAVLSGTPDYMAPEVIRGDAPTAAADLYAVGVILYELLTGVAPFAGGPASTVMLRHLEDDVVPPTLRCPDRSIAPKLEQVVMRALHKDPAGRFPSASAFAVALHDAARDIRDVAEPVTTIPRAAFSTEAPTNTWKRDEVPDEIRPYRLARGSRQTIDTRVDRARAAVGDAIAGGEVCDISASYLELARALVDEQRLHAAVTELEEAIELLSAHTERHRKGAGSTWPILLALAALYDGIGSRGRARAIGLRGQQEAARAGSSIGTARAATLLARLFRQVLPSRPRRATDRRGPP